ncbi:MAG TPA: gluconate 2-dehydrogenase subunit 3 family protein [Gemmatimonadaceae bacterium]|nr:gluconate 2-dehydrogenase subunit 3 family protein [Gemmatimonadaceae bacterium]
MAQYQDESDRLGGIALIDRREAIRRVALFLGGTTLVGGSALLTACERERPQAPATGPVGEFTSADIAYLDEIAETILPETKTPGAKAAKTGAFMALMVTDSYSAPDQKIFRDGMLKLDEASRKETNATFMAATPEQRLAVLSKLDREQRIQSDSRAAASRKARGLPPAKQEEQAEQAEPEKHLPDQRRELAPGSDVGAATAITADTPSHYFRMMKELALLGYFTSEIGCTQAQRYMESPGRFDPCTEYRPGEKAWAPHA